MKQRNTAIDIAKGIAIILVILGHQGDIPMDPWRRIIFSFHMPLFFLIAGYFYHKVDILEGIKKDCKRLILPYCATCLVLFLWTILLNIHHYDPHSILTELIAIFYGSGSGHGSLYLAHAPSIGAVWFLLALFWCKNIFNIGCNKSKKQLSTYIIMGGIAVTATLVDRYLINIPFGILPGLSAIMFYMIGYMFALYKTKMRKYRQVLLGTGFFSA